jgi:hypothetical protein
MGVGYAALLAVLAKVTAFGPDTARKNTRVIDKHCRFVYGYASFRSMHR